MKKRGNISINVTLRRVRAVEKQYIVHTMLLCVCVCVCVALFIEHAKSMSRIILTSVRPVPLYHIFHISYKARFSKKRFGTYNMCFEILCKFCLNHVSS